MIRNIESYKRNKKGNIEVTYTVKNINGEKIKIKQEYTERELLEELKKMREEELLNYGSICLKNNLTAQNVINNLCILGLSIMNKSGIVGTVSAITSLKFISEFLKEYNEIRAIEKFSYYTEYEEDFNKFNENMAIIKNQINNQKTYKKIKKMSLTGEEMNISSINKFSKKELKNIKETTNKLV